MAAAQLKPGMMTSRVAGLGRAPLGFTRPRLAVPRVAAVEAPIATPVEKFARNPVSGMSMRSIQRPTLQPQAEPATACHHPQDGSFDLSAPPPFSLQDLRNAIPAHCWEKNTLKSMAYLALDVLIVAGLAVAAYTINQWCVI